jgi:hypothetical protein
MLIKTQPSGGGWLLLDNRNAPLPGRPALFEADTYTCTHCQRVVVMNPERKRERYKCRGCDHHICDGCAALRTEGGACRTFSQVADEYLTAHEKATASGLILA